LETKHASDGALGIRGSLRHGFALSVIAPVRVGADPETHSAVRVAERAQVRAGATAGSRTGVVGT